MTGGGGRVREIVLLTDFGLEGPYVGQMKGVLAERAPESPVIDLTHAVAPHDVREAAFLLEVSWNYFVKGTVFVSVVDPGVGTSREALALEWEGRFFVGPDNGSLIGALPVDAEPECVALRWPEHRPPEVSRTFHGRDLFAPAAAALARGALLEALGPCAASRVVLPNRWPARDGLGWRGEVVHIDRFGTLVTNISEVQVQAAAKLGKFVIEGPFGRIDRWVNTYGDACPGEAVALIGSMGYLEIAVVQGNAARQLGGTRRTPVALMVEGTQYTSIVPNSVI